MKNQEHSKNSKLNNNPTILSNKISKVLINFFSEAEIEEVAKETGFCSRSSKLGGYSFLDLLVFESIDNNMVSLNDSVSQLKIKKEINISRQGINNRFSSKSVAFIKALLERYLKSQNNCAGSIKLSDKFETIRIKDATSFQIPENMMEKYAGSGGSASKAMLKIQFEYDYKTGDIIDLSLHAFTSTDIRNAVNTLDDIKKNDLILRDLGYVSIKVMKAIKAKDGFFINRVNSNTSLFKKVNNEFIRINYVEILRMFKKSKQQIIDNDIYIGRKEKFPIRIVFEQLPKEQVEKRIRNVQKTRKKNKNKVQVLSKEEKARLSINTFITNITKEDLPGNQVRSVYRLRWQIELMFKVWKSIGGIHKTKKMKIERFETYIYAKLLWIMINWKIMWAIQVDLWKREGILISFYKAFKTLKNRIEKFRTAILTSTDLLTTFIREIIVISPKVHNLEKKKNNLASFDIINMLN